MPLCLLFLLLLLRVLRSVGVAAQFIDSFMQLCSALLDTFMGVNAVGGGWLFLASLLNGLNANPRWAKGLRIRV